MNTQYNEETRQNVNFLFSVCFAAGLKAEASNIFDPEYLEVDAKKTNVKKLVKVAAALKYSGKHLVINLKGVDFNEPYLRIWIENNTEQNSRKDYTLIGFEHDLESLA